MEKGQREDSNGQRDDHEPKENDKLRAAEENNTDMEKVTLPKDKPSRFELRTKLKSAKEHLASHPHHRILLILTIFIILLLIVVIILSVRLGSIVIPIVENNCESSHCLRASATVIAALNTTFNPCQDFWSFSCNGWSGINPIPINKGSISVRDQIKDKINHELRHYIDLLSIDTEIGSPESKIRTFYASCLNVEDIEYNSHNSLKYYIKEIGGWSLLSSWSFQSWDKNRVIERLQTRFGITPYFKVDVGPDDLDPNQPYIIKIEPDGIGLPGKSYYFDSKYDKHVAAYKNFMRELAKQFDAQTIQANQFAESMFSYEKRIAEITPDLEEYQNPANYIKKRYSIRELRSIAPSIEWLSLLQLYYPNAQINEGTRVLLAFEQYFKDISNIIATTDNGALNDYLMWRFTSAYAPYLSKPFRLIHNEFHQTMNGLEQNELVMAEDRWEFCLRVTSKFAGPALGALFVKHKLNNRVDIEVKAQTKVINTVKNSLLNFIDKFVWARNEDARNLIKNKIKQMELLIGQPNFVIKDSDLKTYFAEMLIQSNFFQNILHGFQFLNRKKEILLISRNSVTDKSWPLMPQDVDIKYQYAGNKLVIPIGFLNYPIFDTNLPSALQFGALGFHVAAEILRAFDLKGLQYGLPDFRLSQTNSWFPDEAKQTLHNRLQCLYHELHRYTEKSELSPNLTYSQSYIDIGALMAAYDSYKYWVKNNGDDGTLPGIHRNNDQLFFIGFAQSMCENVRPRKSIVLSDYSTQLPSRVRVLTVLRQSETFSNVFGCPKSSPMKSEEMCHLW